MFMNNFTRHGGFVKFWQSVMNLSCCNIDSITKHSMSIKTLVFTMLMLFSVGSMFGQTSARSVYLDRCLADAPEPQFTQEDLEDLYMDECDGLELTFTVTPEIAGRGGDQSAPELSGSIPSDMSDLNLCMDAIPEGPTEAEIAAEFSDNCTLLDASNVTKSVELDSSNTDCAWTVTFTYALEDDCGNAYEGDIKVVYSGGDTEAPKLKKNTDIPDGDLNSQLCFLDKPQGPSEAEIADLFKDNCTTITADNVTKTGFSKGNNCKWMAEYTYDVVDDCGNAYPPFTIKYAGRDLTSPVLAGIPADVTVECISDVPPMPKKNQGPTATDNCDTDVDISVSVDMSGIDQTCQQGTIVRTWTAMDDCGNEDVQSQTITVMDTMDPILTIPADETVECDAIPEIGEATAIDNCDPNVTVQFVSESEVDNDGDGCANTYTIFRIWLATDCVGNFVQKTQTITVQDTTAPVLTVPADVVVQCDAVPVLDEHAATATDTCDENVEVTFIEEKRVDGDCANAYTLFRIWKAADCAGNETLNEQTIQVIDTVAPVLVIPADVTVQCDEVPEVGMPTATDSKHIYVKAYMDSNR